MNKNIYEFTVKNIYEKKVKLDIYKGKVLLIVNTASKCGLKGQFKELHKLKNHFAEKDFEILAFPSNDFMNQEPLNGKSLCDHYEEKFKVNYPVFSKIHVNGKNEEPLFTYLKKSLNGFLGSSLIKWNFTKFLIDKNGLPKKRYKPQSAPLKIIKDIENLL